MRLRIPVYAEQFTIFYRAKILSLIKDAIKASGNGELYYPEDGREVAKPFCSALRFPRGTRTTKEQVPVYGRDVEAEVFHIPRGQYATLYVDSADIRFTSALYAGLALTRNNIPGLTIGNPEIVQTPQCGKVLKVKTLSPIVVQDALSVADPFFSARINTIFSKKSIKYRGRDFAAPLVFEPVNVKAHKVKHALRTFSSDHTNPPFLILQAFSGEFVIRGHKDDLEFARSCGFGERTGQGFGMVFVGDDRRKADVSLAA